MPSCLQGSKQSVLMLQITGNDSSLDQTKRPLGIAAQSDTSAQRWQGSVGGECEQKSPSRINRPIILQRRTRRTSCKRLARHFDTQLLGVPLPIFPSAPCRPSSLSIQRGRRRSRKLRTSSARSKVSTPRSRRLLLLRRATGTSSLAHERPGTSPKRLRLFDRRQS